MPGRLPLPRPTAKKRSKTGVRFVYFDVNGVLVRFFHRAFTEIAEDIGARADLAENLFWRFNDRVCSGEMSLEELNNLFKQELHVEAFNWKDYYMRSVEPMPGIKEFVEWTAKYYEIGLMSNSAPGFLDEMLANGLIPDVDYTAVVDSSKVGIYQAGSQDFPNRPGDGRRRSQRDLADRQRAAEPDRR